MSDKVCLGQVVVSMLLYLDSRSAWNSLASLKQGFQGVALMKLQIDRPHIEAMTQAFPRRVLDDCIQRPASRPNKTMFSDCEKLHEALSPRSHAAAIAWHNRPGLEQIQ